MNNHNVKVYVLEDHENDLPRKRPGPVEPETRRLSREESQLPPDAFARLLRERSEEMRGWAEPM